MSKHTGRAIITVALAMLVATSACGPMQPTAVPAATPVPPAATAEPTAPPTAAPPAATLPPTATSAPASTATPDVPTEEVRFEGAGDATLAATLFGEGDLAVILLHQGAGAASQVSWHAFARQAAERGFAALTVDFRSRGQSEGEIIDDYWFQDALAAAEFLRGRGFDKLACMGAGIWGAEPCMRLAVQGQLEGVVILSNPMTIESSERITAEQWAQVTVPKLFVYGTRDREGVPEGMEEMYRLAGEPKELITYDTSARGTDLFRSAYADDFTQQLLRFLEGLRLGGTGQPGTPPLSLVDSGQQLGSGCSFRVALGDLDGDGDLDAFVINIGPGPENAVWLNDGQAIFTSTAQQLGHGQGVALGDLDGDGDLDALITDWQLANQVWLNDGAGTFANNGQLLGDKGFDAALGDLDGDGDLDAFIARLEANTVWLNDGKGDFVDSGQTLGQAITADVVLADLDSDGDLDALAGGWDEPGKVWLNDGTGTFNDSGHDLTPSRVHIHGLELGDLDGDGDLDAVMAIASGDPNQVWLNDGTGVFSDSGQRLRTPLAHGVALGDLDGDGDLDAVLAIKAPGQGGARVWLNDGRGNLHDSGIHLGSEGSYAAALGDLDGDGDLDIWVTHGDWSTSARGIPNEVWLNTSR